MQLQFPDEHPVAEDLPFAEQATAPMLTPPPAPEVPVAPVAPRQGRKIAAVVGAVAAVVAIVVVIAVVSVGEDGTPVASPGAGQVAGTTSEVPVTTTTTTDPVPADEGSARQLLENQVADDRPHVEAVVGSWVPQLSSKQPGLVANGTTYDYRAIWADFTTLQARYPGALLLWSGDYNSFKLPDYWVTIAPEAFGTGEAANGWCDSAGIGKDNCFAKRITLTGGYEGNTLFRK